MILYKLELPIPWSTADVPVLGINIYIHQTGEPVKTLHDPSVFDEHHQHFAIELVRTIRRTLQQQALDSEALDDQAIYDLTSSLSFNISALIDGSATSGDASTPTIAHLAFKQAESDGDVLLTSDEGTYLHEISEGIVEDEFE
ncbi:hypothetical protein CHH28_08950 [Bacterioplanes sanyensis]|uniref:Uncharacterized protein n=1 Tax=Bacterioplanes sanyensis TaxID=1249553 RepID=A0A222FJ46_9GAMM|nr:hypothetical protein CHH28_08950 [Bacterioplanes sanyensis]